jgi:hypothetical protein
MHPLLQPNLSTPIAVVSAALWCAAAVAVIVAAPEWKNAPLAAAVDPVPPPNLMALADDEQVSTPKADRLPLFVPQSVITVNPEELPIIQPPARSVKPVKQIDDERPSRRARRAHAEARDICERHGMHKQFYHRGRYESWRCRR